MLQASASQLCVRLIFLSFEAVQIRCPEMQCLRGHLVHKLVSTGRSCRQTMVIQGNVLLLASSSCFLARCLFHHCVPASGMDEPTSKNQAYWSRTGSVRSQMHSSCFGLLDLYRTCLVDRQVACLCISRYAMTTNTHKTP